MTNIHNAKAYTPTSNAIRAIAMDAVQKANSGHPGAPMGMANIADILWRKHLKHNPSNPSWWDRDRFVLSNGHASMLIYALLYLSGYDINKDDLQNFRQMHSKTPGHPENGITPGVETTTGPLGQGITNAVGMALAEKIFAARYNRTGLELFNHYTWVFVGDGCLMEGISHEAASLAGTWKLNKLVVFYDANDISIDGDIKGWFTDDTAQRFKSYGWNVIGTIDGHDEEEINNSILQAKAENDRPTLIITKTIIGSGSPNKGGTSATHGAALGDDEVSATRKEIGWEYPPFAVPDEILNQWNAVEAGNKLDEQWQDLFAKYQQQHPQESSELERVMSNELPKEFSEVTNQLFALYGGSEKSLATRKASQECLEKFMGIMPELIGGSADLAGSNLTNTKQSKDIVENKAGNKISFGVREFGMSAIANGLSLHGGMRPFVATFLVFSDYARNAIRMAALMNQPIIYVFSHDSIGLGEDGPTHQPIEHVSSLRIIPNLNVWRPCDAFETAVAWVQSIKSKTTPSVLALSRQGLKPQVTTGDRQEKAACGGYVLHDFDDGMDENAKKVVVIATGSEVEIAVEVKTLAKEKSINVRVVSMPCFEVFSQQSAQYKDSVLPKEIKRVVVEAGVTTFWSGLVGFDGKVVGIDRFGESAPANELFSYFGITAVNVLQVVESV